MSSFKLIEASQAQESPGIIRITNSGFRTAEKTKDSVCYERYDTLYAFDNIKTALDANPRIQNPQVIYFASFEEADKMARSMSINPNH